MESSLDDTPVYIGIRAFFYKKCYILVYMKDEEKVLSFWKKNRIFEKSLERESSGGNFVFYDGPPFATGTPHYGHILPGTMKDIIPRYQTMKGKRVRRVWGWDCHGLPIESLVQKELGVSTKKDIENFGIERFNEAARASVFRYDAEWKRIIPKTGRWIDMENQYTTMDQGFTESVWWGFKKVHDKGLVYEDFKSMHVSPLLETPLSNFEVNQNYKDIEDISVYAKFELIDESKTFILAWTTTPWTLPGNAALAVGDGIEYIKAKKDREQYIVAKDLAEKVLKEEYEIIDTFKGSKIVGRSYKPVFDHYYNKQDLENRENGWKIYAAGFVTVEDGTGIVHVAPAFGEDDLNLGKSENLPFIQHVNIDGTIKAEIAEFAGRQAKPKSTPDEPKKHQETDIEVLKNLAHRGLLFDKEKYVHSYPHCWRTDAPLLNYAMSSWFIKVTDLKDKIVSLNKSVNWVPEDIRDGRFGNWLEGARDWAISRNRYWGAPIPIWKSEDGKDVEVLGSIEDIRKRVPDLIKDIYVMRHGESEKNTLGVFDRELDKYPLTENGKEEAKRAAKDLNGKIDLVITSPVRRAKETAEIVAGEIGIEVSIADELIEVDQGTWEGKREDEVDRKSYDNLPEEQHYRAPRGERGESWKDVEERVYDFVKQTVSDNPNKRILFVTHAGVIVYLTKVLRRLSFRKTADLFQKDDFKAYARPIHFYIDTSTEKEFDFHRPYIDNITWKNDKGKVMKRIPDVFDTWIDSGSMPFAQVHYPFENREEFEKKDSPLFPADFLAESLDQTRGWFYTLLVLNSALFGKSPYKNVAVGGLILAEDGRKMSKSLNNYPEMDYIIEKYGGDALRYYLMASPAVRGEEMLFSEKGVDEVLKKIILRLKNVHSFYMMYKTGNIRNDSDYVLDKWLLERFNILKKEVTKSLDSFELDKASRPFGDFVDDLSTWYVRRSRDRFKEGKTESIETLGYVLKELSKVLAPIMPFVSEEIYQDIRIDSDPESVHLENWPEEDSFWKNIFAKRSNILEEMKEVRGIISEALEKRSSSGIKVRQPLSSLTLKGKVRDEYIELIKDEVNVKEVVFGDKLELDTNITEDLKKEGVTRDVIRFIQDLRKKAGLNPDDLIVVVSDKEILGADEVKKQVNASNISIVPECDGDVLKTSLGDIKISIERK